jgi:hypothetical protein
VRGGISSSEGNSKKRDRVPNRNFLLALVITSVRPRGRVICADKSAERQLVQGHSAATREKHPRPRSSNQSGEQRGQKKKRRRHEVEGEAGQV